MSSGIKNKTQRLPCGREIPQEASHKVQARIETAKERLKEYLESEGLNFSGPRWKVAETILRANHHFSSQDIVREVQTRYPDIGTATIYRSIKTLTEARVLRETLVDQDGNGIFEAYEDEHHDHIVCLDCGHIFEFHDDDVERAQNSVTQKLGFRQHHHRHTIFAHCKAYSEK